MHGDANCKFKVPVKSFFFCESVMPESIAIIVTLFEVRWRIEFEVDSFGKVLPHGTVLVEKKL